MKSKFVLLFFAINWFVCLNSSGTNISPVEMKFDSLKVKAQERINTSEEICYLDSMLQLAQTTDSVYWECLAMSFMARNYYNRMVPDSFMYWAERVDSIALRHKHYKLFFDTFSLVCSWDLYEKNYDNALENSNRLYLLAKELNNADGLIASHETIGLIYMETFRYMKAIKSFNEGLELQRQQKNPRYGYQFQFLSYIVECYLKLKDYSNVQQTLSEASELVEICKVQEKNFPVRRCLWLLNCYYIEMYVQQQLPHKAEAYIIEADRYKDIDDFYVFCYYNLVSASYYQLLGDYTQALKRVNLVLAQTDEGYLPALKMKAELLLKSGKGEEAALLYHKSTSLIDSIYNESFSKQINQLRTIHELDKQELHNKQEELEDSQNKLTITLILTSLLLLGLIIIGIDYWRIKSIKKQLKKVDKELKEGKELLFLSEKELSLARERAEASNHFKDVLLANLSHEIRTPLSTIVGFSSILGNMQKRNEAKKYVSIIKHNSDLLLKIVNDVVSVSMLQTNQTAFVKEEVDVILLCKSLTQDYAQKAKPDVIVKTELPPQETYFLKTDSAHLQQILENLLSNAVKFTDKGYITLSFKPTEAGDAVHFIVTDTGCSIPEYMQEKIFDSFQKHDSTIQGIGLGLTLCKQIAQNLNGSIHLDTEYKNGTRIIFTHPIS